jgi:heme/copper-type cytochrome/quinol oxidase subunit 2
MSRNLTILKGGIMVLVSSLLACLTPDSALACSACFGQNSGPMAQGMNWGIFSLLAVIVSVLIAVAGFFVFLARRASLRSVPVSGTTTSERAKPSWEVQKPQPQTA